MFKSRVNGIFLKPEMVNVSISTIKRFAKLITPLYEQGAADVRIRKYVMHWLKWVRSGLGGREIMRAKECMKKRSVVR